MASPRVLLADDSPEVLEKVAQLFRDDLDIVARLQNGQAALAAAASIDPDLVILDIAMPLLNGIQVASRLQDLGSRAKVVFLTVHEDQDYVEAAFSAGALGYVLKSRMLVRPIPWPCVSGSGWFNGTILIESKPMGGTTIHVRVPLDSEQSADRKVV